MSTIAARARLAAGVLGPSVFIASWALLGARAQGYSPVYDPISRLAALGAPTRGVMTGGLLAFGLGAVLLADELRRRRTGPLWGAVGLCGLATAAVAALPLGSPLTEGPHLVAALVSYAALALSPALAARSGLPADRAVGGRSRWWRWASAAVAAGTAGALAASLIVEPTGLVQRIGLTLGDIWIAALAVHSWREG